MKLLLVITVCSGLFVPRCSSRYYIPVPTLKVWTDAQSFCRSNYTELAAVQNEQQLAELNRLIGNYSYVWIGLRPDFESWRWSLENQDFYGAGQASFRNWQAAGPGGTNYYKVCVAMTPTGEWKIAHCETNHFAFFCYEGSAAALDPSPKLIYSTLSKTWSEAQQYCRMYYTDLASVRNQAENNQMKAMIKSQYNWIGLYREAWKWSDGSPGSVTNWDTTAPSANDADACVVSNFGKWTNVGCSSRHTFVCFAEPAVRKQMVQVELKNLGSSVEMDQLRDGILQQLYQRLNEEILEEDVNLGWVNHPGGNIFLKKNQDKQEQKKNCLI